MIQKEPYLMKKVEEALVSASAIPLWGETFPFPWKDFSEQLSKKFQVKNFKISHHKTEWLEEKELLSGLGDHPYILAVTLTPLSIPCYFAMSFEDISKLTSYLLTKDHLFKGFSDHALKEGFYHFLMLQSFEILSQVKALGNLSPKLTHFSSLPEERALCIDILIHLNSLKLWARVICPETFREAFKKHVAYVKPSFLTEEIAKKLTLPLRLEVGSTQLKYHLWQEVKEGDFVILDRCTWDPTSLKGTGQLLIKNTPLFQARIKQNEVKIIDYAFYQEEMKTMDKEKEENFEDETIEETESPILAGQEAEEATGKLIASSEIPITLKVEVGHLTMSINKLLQLKPGNILELNTTLEQGVDLTVSGKKVARGELVKLGEVIGVKILQVAE